MPSARPSGPRRALVPLLILAITAALVTAVLVLRPGTEETAEEPGPGAAAGTSSTDPERGAVEDPSEVALPDLSSEEARDPDDLLAVGPVDAPVDMIVFTDYQCPYCARWTTETLPQLQHYIDEGTLRVEFREVNVYGEDSVRAARAALAAAKQGKHEEYQAALFEDGEIRSGSQLSEKALVQLARELGLDVDAFRRDLNSDQVAEVIAKNQRQGVQLGASSTPSFIIGGTPLVGAQPARDFEDAIEKARTEAEG